VRLKALPADFRFPMMDLRLSLAHLCALDAAIGQFQRIGMTGWLRRAGQLTNLLP
jgi:hypothetical protein